MDFIPYLVACAAMAVFVIAVVVRFNMWAKMPMHLRWELYPVAHEAEKAHYGGSYLEESEWWNKPRQSSLLGELKVMIPEIVFLVAVREHNPSLWVRTFPFHFGLYMVIGATVAMMGMAAVGLVMPQLLAGSLGTLVHYGILALGAGGLCLGIIGAVGLLHRRLTDKALRDYTTPADIFNLLFFIVAFGCALFSFILVDRDLSRAGMFVNNLVTLNWVSLPGAGLEVVLPTASVILLSSLAAYVPLTHMSHFIGKYFAYHSIRWKDAPNLPGGPEEQSIQQLLSQPVTWSASHIGAGGNKNWVDVATEIPTEEKKA